MIDTKYDTVQCNKYEKKYAESIDTIAYNTALYYIKWQKRHIDSVNVDYYYASDDEYREHYYLYKTNEPNEIVLQIVSDQDKLNYELDSNTFNHELESLLKDVKDSIGETEKDDYSSYYPNYYKSYKEIKMEKATKQLSNVEPMRNYEIL